MALRLQSIWLGVRVLCLLSHRSFLQIEALQSHHAQRSHQSVQLKTSSPNQPYRTSYHFQPPKNWMNDPNGPMIYKGIYHLFYQYNPKGAVWSNIVWGHSTSTDLINWTPQKHALIPSQPSDINGCWSGSATFLPGGKPAIMYTGIDPNNQQLQNLVLPKNASDPFLREWIKQRYNPIMAPTSANKINATSFRDPSTAWLGYDGRWRLIVGSQQGDRGLAILYRSKGINDFEHWSEAKHPLHSAAKSGMWECPDFYPVPTTGQAGVDTSLSGKGLKHVLKKSLFDTKHDCYTLGTYDVKERFIPDEGTIEGDKGLRHDYGKFYASKTFFDGSKNRRILWGWVNESSPVEDDIQKGWSGIQAIPRSVWLDKSGKQLLHWPVVEIEQLRTNPVILQREVVKAGSTLNIANITAAQADVEIWFDVEGFEKAEEMDPSWVDPQELCNKKGAAVKGGIGPFGLLVLASEGLKEYTAVYFRIFKAQSKPVLLMCSDQSRSSLNKGNDKATYGAFVDVDPIRQKVSLRTLVDHSVVESFAGEGKTCITARVYPSLAIDGSAHLHVFNNGSGIVGISKLRAWSMKTAQIH